MCSRLIGLAVSALWLAGCSSSVAPIAPSTNTLGVTTSFTMSFSNPDTTSIQRTLTLPANPNVTMTTVSCAAGGGATCPPSGDLIGANLYSGGIGYNVSPGGTLSFTITKISPSN